MAHVQTIDPQTATGAAKDLLDAVQKKLGVTPNLTRVLANSPNALNGYLSFSGALAGGALDKKLAEQIALTVAGFNGCDYCASAHTAIGKSLGLDADELALNLRGNAQDVRTAAALAFAKTVTREHGRVSDTDIEAIRAAGFSDAEIVEIIAHVALNTFTNYVNIGLDVEIDFPKVSTADTRRAA